MPSNRYYLPIPLHEEETIALEAEELHHMRKVMRKQSGDTVEIVNGSYQFAEATIITIDKNLATLRIITVSSEPIPTPLIIASPYSQQSKLDTIVEKGCELGATAFWFYPAELGEKSSLSESHKKRLNSILIASMKQSGRLDLPQMEYLQAIKRWQKPSFRLLFGDTRKEAPWLKDLLNKNLLGTIFLFGPEKGLSHNEIGTLEKMGAKGVRLHKNILRMETAPLCALSILS
jgi:16S rRNA (uracil1498-N3)-methyltransferase